MVLGGGKKVESFLRDGKTTFYRGQKYDIFDIFLCNPDKKVILIPLKQVNCFLIISSVGMTSPNRINNPYRFNILRLPQVEFG